MHPGNRPAVLLLVLSLALAGCGDRAVAPTTTSPQAQTAIFEPDEGYDTYQTADVSWTFTGDYDGFAWPTARRLEGFRLEQVVSGGQLHTTVRYPTSPEVIFNVPSEVDLSSAHFAPSQGFTATYRSGGTLTPPDSATIHNNGIYMDASDPYRPSMTNMARGVELATGVPPLTFPRRRIGWRASPVTAVEELANIRRRAQSEQRIGPTELLFAFEAAGERHELRFSELIGTVTEIRVYGGGALRRTITQTYVADGVDWLPVERTTVFYAPDGSPRNRFTETFGYR